MGEQKDHAMVKPKGCDEESERYNGESKRCEEELKAWEGGGRIIIGIAKLSWIPIREVINKVSDLLNRLYKNKQ